MFLLASLHLIKNGGGQLKEQDIKAQFRQTHGQSMNNNTVSSLSSPQRISALSCQFIICAFRPNGTLNRRSWSKPPTKTQNSFIYSTKVGDIGWWHDGLSKWTNLVFEQHTKMQVLFQPKTFDNPIVHALVWTRPKLAIWPIYRLLLRAYDLYMYLSTCFQTPEMWSKTHTINWTRPFGPTNLAYCRTNLWAFFIK